MNKKGALANFLTGILALIVIVILLFFINFIFSRAVQEVEKRSDMDVLVLESMQSSRNFLYLKHDGELMIDIVSKHALNESFGDACDSFNELIEAFFDDLSGFSSSAWVIRYEHVSDRRNVCTFRGGSVSRSVLSNIVENTPPMLIPNPDGEDIIFYAKRVQPRDDI